MKSAQEPIRVMVVDDTIVYRKIVSDVLSGIPDVEVVGTANNGKTALSRLKQLNPDFITLDIEMPEMNGLDVLAHIHEMAPEIGVVMLSTLTQHGSDMTIRALELGAFDFIPKPQSGTMTENTEAIRQALTPMVKNFLRRKKIRTMLQPSAQRKPRDLKKESALLKPEPDTAAVSSIRERMQRLAGIGRTGKSEIVAIGISTGGPNALAQMMPQLPEDLGVPIVVVQHMPPMFTQSLAKSLDAKCKISVREAMDGDILIPNTAFIAPGGKQMKVMAGADGKNRILKITDDPPENSCKPSADYLFRSVAHHYVGRATAVIMTGMGSDGTKGLELLKQNGAIVIAQNEETCTVFGMPKEPIEKKIVDVIAPLGAIAQEIVKTVKK